MKQRAHAAIYLYRPSHDFAGKAEYALPMPFNAAPILRSLMFAALIACIAKPALADPNINVVYLKANWCPLCARLGPRLDDAIFESPKGKIGRIDLDMSALRGHGQDVKWQTISVLKQQAASANISYIWDWYGGHPGLVVITAADNGEPLTCLTSEMEVSEMKARLQESLVLATVTAPGKRRLSGTDCPAPLRPQNRN